MANDPNLKQTTTDKTSPRTNRNLTNPPKKHNTNTPVCTTSLPSIFSVPNTKVSNVFAQLLGKGEQSVDVGNNTRTQVNVYFMPITDEAEADKRVRILTPIYNPTGIDLTYTEFDRAVLGAVASLVQAGNTVILPSTIARLITGCPNMTKVSDELIEHICESMEKQRYIHVKLDYTEELKRKRNGECFDSANIKGSLVSSTEYTVYAGGYSLQGFEVSSVPILFRYADDIDQVLPIPLELLAVGGSDTVERVALKHYMLRRILARVTKMQDRILFKNLYEIAGITELTSASRTPRTRVNKFVHTCLSAWLEMGILTDFDYEKDKKGAYIAIEFKTPSRRKNKAIEQPPELPEPPEPPAEVDENQIDEARDIIAAFGTYQDT